MLELAEIFLFTAKRRTYLFQVSNELTWKGHPPEMLPLSSQYLLL